MITRHDCAYCQKGYERCRIRPSVNHVVSFILFFISIVTVILSLRQNSLTEALRASGVGSDFNSQFIWLVIPFAVIYIAHLVRIYVSTLMIENDPDFYYTNIIQFDGDKLKRFSELTFRLFVVLSVVVCTTVQAERLYRQQIDRQLHATLVEQQNKQLADKKLDDQTLNKPEMAQPLTPSWNTFFFKTFFSPVVWVYVFLIAWDWCMIVCSKLPKWKSMRAFFVANDLVGIVAVSSLIVLEMCPSIVITKSTFIISIIVLYSLGLLGVVLLYKDLKYNGAKYKAFFGHEWNKWWHDIPCSSNCPAQP